MLSPVILVPAVLNGLMAGAVYALVALGLTLIYGVLHIINFAHGALLTAAMFAAFFAFTLFGIDPYLTAIVLTPLFFGTGYALQRFIIGPAAHGEDRGFLLVTLGLAVVIENTLLYFFRADTGKAIRAVAKEKLGAELCGINVAHIYGVTFGVGAACVAIAACLLIPT